MKYKMKYLNKYRLGFVSLTESLLSIITINIDNFQLKSVTTAEFKNTPKARWNRLTYFTLSVALNFSSNYGGRLCWNQWGFYKNCHNRRMDWSTSPNRSTYFSNTRYLLVIFFIIAFFLIVITLMFRKSWIDWLLWNIYGSPAR